MEFMYVPQSVNFASFSRGNPWGVVLRCVTNEQVKIEKYCAGLQHDLKQLCRASPTGARWARLQDLMQYAML
jgi:hypothetical protein